MPNLDNIEKLSRFLVDAKIQTYASGNDEFIVKPELNGSHQFEFNYGNLCYRDIYFGNMRFIGIETVFQDDKPIWGMSYYGGTLPSSSETQISGMPSLLKAALREVSVETPFRGPESFQKDPYYYSNQIQGNFKTFHGIETICIQNQAIYRLYYNGGVLD